MRNSHLRSVIAAVLLAATLVAGLNAPAAYGMGVSHLAPKASQPSQSTSNLFDPQSTTTSVSHPELNQTASGNAPAGPPVSLKRTFPMPMHAGFLPLAAGHAAQFTGSDGKFEVDVPPNAVTPDDVAAAGGRLSLQISQIAPASGSNAGGSGLASFGTYLVQLVDANGVLVTTHGLRQPITVKFHYGKGESVFDLSRVFVVMNGALPDDTTLAPLVAQQVQPTTPGLQQDVVTASPPTPTQANSHFGAWTSANASLDTANTTLTISPLLTSPSTSMSWNTDAPVATFGSPDPFNVDLNAGSLSSSFPIDVPSGPGGLTPPVTLTYSSASVSEQHNAQAAAGWVGEGWNLDLGAISWAEHNVTSSCVSTCGNTWEGSWQLSDPFGTSVELIPPNINVSTYFDDTSNNYCGADGNANNATSYPCPIRWHTSPENYAKVYAYVGPLSLPDGAGVHPPCFRIWLTNGIMEEFGCTADSIAYYYTPGAGDYISSWKLDLITDPQGNQIHITYTRDIAQKSVSGVNHQYDRDTVLNTIEWDSPNCDNPQTMCTGSSWVPLMRVSFAASHAPTRLTGTAPVGCNTGTNLRCDDPLDLTSSGGLAAPDVQSTYVLNDVNVQVRSSGTGSWNTLKDYQFSYSQTGVSSTQSTQIQDPATGKEVSEAGSFLLTTLNTVGDNGSTALPPRTFTYFWNVNTYVDDIFHPNPSTNCGGIVWNTGNGNGCLLWSRSFWSNSYYLWTADNGMGLHQTFTWANARNNTHGVNGGGTTNSLNPFYCNGLTAAQQATYPCSEVDDQNWSRIVLTQQKDDVKRAASSGTSTISSVTHYSYTLATATAKECNDCTSDMYWGNINDGDYLDFYNSKYMGFAEADVTNPDGSYEEHKYNATLGYGVYDTSQVSCFATMAPVGSCSNDPWWNVTNATHGHEIEADYYNTDGVTLLKKNTAQYAVACPPSGVSGTPSSTEWGNWDGKLVSALDHNNPVAACAIQTTRTDAYIYDGASSGIPQATTTYTYDSYGRTTSTTVNSNGGGAAMGSPTTIVTHTDYINNDAVNAQYSSVTGTYLIDVPADTIVEDSGGTTHYSCSYTSYDGQGWATGQQSTLTHAEATSTDTYTTCSPTGNTGLIRHLYSYDTYGDRLTDIDPDANAGITSHKGCTVGSSTYTTCQAYDATYHMLPTTTTNALGQQMTVGYSTSPSATDGFGLWPITVTDANDQNTSTAYDALGRVVKSALPGDTITSPTTTTSYTVWCTATGAQTPCVEIDQTQRLVGSTTVTARSFYDGDGRLIETRTPSPTAISGANQDVVQFVEYDAAGRAVYQSVPYYVPAYTGAPGSAAFSTPDESQPHSETTYDGLGRVKTTQNALQQTTTMYYGAACGYNSDAACYEVITVKDALEHMTQTFTDALGRETYSRTLTGNDTLGHTFYTVSRYAYDANGNLTKITQPDGSTTTFTYDAAGRQLAMTDPDRGHETYAYDANGNVLHTTDARGANIYAGYDGLNRQLWRNSSNTITGAYVTYSYDDTTNGGGTNQGVGRLTAETFNNPSDSSLSGSYSYLYDTRGQLTSTTTVLVGNSYTTSATYNDAGEQTSLTYPDGMQTTTGYSQGWFAGLTLHLGASTDSLLNTVSYAGQGGAFGTITSATIGSLSGNALYSYSATADALGREATATVGIPNGAALISEQPSYDAAGNVSSVATTLPAGTDTQVFCYDDLNRLIWAGAGAGTNPCGTGTGSSFSGATYSQSFAYDTLDRLTSGPAGSYTYGDSAHLHAATSTSGGYTASYDTSGEMVCRAPTSTSTCSGSSPTGQSLAYDTEGRLTAWQNAPSSPTTTAGYLYDGEGNRVVQKVTASGTTTTTTRYLGSLEAVTTSGSTTTTTDYFFGPTGLLAETVNGATGGLSSITYLVTNYQGSVIAALNRNGGVGGVAGSRLYAPYGGGRYTSGAFPTDYGYTGQRADSATGLDDYGARYYDPALGQFTSADTMLAGGLNRYAYVGGNPTTFTDPSGHMSDEGGDRSGGVAVAEGGTTPENLRDGFTGAGTVLVLPSAQELLMVAGIMLVGAIPIISIVLITNAITAARQMTAEPAASRSEAIGGSWDIPTTYLSTPPTVSSPLSPVAASAPTGGSGSTGGGSGSTGSGTSAPPATQTGGGSAGAPPGGGTPPVAMPVNPDPEEDNCGCEGGITHQTYTVTNNETGEVYSGRTHGTGTPEQNIQRRFNAGHSKIGNGWGDPVLDRSSANGAAIRGREQMLIDYFRSQGIAADQINGVGPRNRNYPSYMDAAYQEFGPITEDPRGC